MNDNLLNDTFDNVSFGEFGTFASKQNSTVCFERKSNLEDSLLTKSKISDNTISFDDSQFLMDSSDEKNANNISAESEDLFSNSLLDCDSINCNSSETQTSTDKIEFHVKDTFINVNSNGEKFSRIYESLESRVTSEHSALQISSQSYKETTLGVEEENCSKSESNLKNENLMTENNVENKNDLKNKQKQLSYWNLPESILQKYKSKSIVEMFQWQADCLSNKSVLQERKNLVYSAPTSAGKTLVAEILAIKTVIENDKKVVIILPFVSVVREKMFYFRDILGNSGIYVEGFMGTYNPSRHFKSVNVAVCTIEKGNSLINRLLEENKLSEVGMIIIDEMHLLGEANRGYLLELLLTKIKYMSERDAENKIQIIGMSATLPNLNVIANWLDAELYVTDFRPIPLYEQIHIDNEIFDRDLKFVRKIVPLYIENDTDNLLQLCLETISISCSVLIFCPTKNWCENLAEQIAIAFWKLGNSECTLGESLRKQLNENLIFEVLEQLKNCPVGLDKVLRKTIAFGVAFHHAGLTMDERDIIEGGFRSGSLRVLVATSTLSSGVNLPARRVIIRTPIFHGRPIDCLTYKQMIGRAGRMGIDTEGESILICQKKDEKILKDITKLNLHPIESCLESDGKLKRALLEVIASGVVSTSENVKLFSNCTLLSFCSNSKNVHVIEETLRFLIRNEFIKEQVLTDGTVKYTATSLGKACLSSSMPPEEGLSLFAELEKARSCFVLETDLHLIYLVTPYSACNQLTDIDWFNFLNIWEKLPSVMKRVGDLVGVKESYIVNSSSGKIQTHTAKLYHQLMVHKRFYAALALQDLIDEIPLNNVAQKFSCSRGLLQSLQQSASTFAGMVTKFCQQLGWSSVEILISQFQDRFQFGINRDLLDLMRLPIMNGQRARALFNSGIETLIDLASCDHCTLEDILRRSVPFESEKNSERNVRSIWINGLKGLTEKEAAHTFIEEARNFLKIEMGLVDVKWQNESKSEVSKECFSDDESNFGVNVSRNGNNCEKKLGQNKLTLNLKINNKSKNVRIVENKSESLEIDRNLETSKQISFFEFSDENFGIDVSQNVINSIKKIELNTSDATMSPVQLKVKNLKIDTKNEDFSDNSSEKLFEESSVSNLSKSIDSIESSLENSFTFNSSNKNFNVSKRISLKRSNSDSVIDNFHSPLKRLKDFDSYNNEGTKDDLDLSNVEIIHTCRNPQLFDCFTKELNEQLVIAFSMACSKVKSKEVIGQKVLNGETTCEKSQNERYTYKDRKVDGFCISWSSNVVYYVSLEEEENVKNYVKINALKETFAKPFLNLRLFDSKEQIKNLKFCCGIELFCEIEDPKIGDWLLNPEGKEKNLQAMALKYSPESLGLAQLAGQCKGVGSVGLDLYSSIDSKIRAGIEAVICWFLVDSIKESLLEQSSTLLHAYNIEMRCILCIAKMEYNGIGVNLNYLQNLPDKFAELVNSIEKKAFEIAGRQFSFGSSKEVAKILGFKGKRASTSKDVLQLHNNPIAKLILNWRKLNGILTKTINPLLRVVENGRIYCCSVMHTSTGRISMQEPNLQNVAKDFEILDPLMGTTETISCRKSFVANGNNMFLSADYCQLELRLLAHFSQDPTLCKIMRSDKDIFSLIASEWHGIRENQVDDQLRQRTKQLCYGIIYGMGITSLAEQMAISVEEATDLVDSFNKRYKSLKKFVEKTIENCRECGYVTTVAGRKRYLPNINSQQSYTRYHAERQAINTVIQGSAADVVKKALVVIERKFGEKFKSTKNRPKLVLHLHDELLYEVSSKYFLNGAKLLKQSMEESVSLSLPFPVKLKSGTSWGEMIDLIL